MIFKKYLLLFSLFLPYIAKADLNSSIESSVISGREIALVNSGEKKAIFREIFTYGFEKITTQVNQQKLAANKWGVVFELNGTLLNSNTQLANPGAVELTCRLKKLGGVIVVIETNSNSDILNTTTSNLEKQGICYSSIVFTNNKNLNKNPIFVAITSGDYENVVTTKKLPPLQVLAYFGNSIEDFPDLKKNLADRLPIADNIFSQFGQKYFILPR